MQLEGEEGGSELRRREKLRKWVNFVDPQAAATKYRSIGLSNAYIRSCNEYWVKTRLRGPPTTHRISRRSLSA